MFSRNLVWTFTIALLVLWAFGILKVGNQAFHLVLVVVLVIGLIQFITRRSRR